MKISAIITLTIAIIGLSLAWYSYDGDHAAAFRIQEGHEQAALGIANKNWTVVSEGLDAIRWGLKDIQIFQGLLALGLVIGLPSSIISLILVVLISKK